MLTEPPTTFNTPLNIAAATYFHALQQTIISAFQALEPDARFIPDHWTKPPGEQLQGHGTSALLRGGQVFEKVGVNFSHVHGTFSPRFRTEIPGGTESDGQFWASGVSLVAHPQNPFVPAVHMNVRRIHTSKSWFGGGMDLTPTFPFADDTQHFHTTLHTACESQRPGSYQTYADACRDYFFLPHRNEERGVGGIFFDYLEPTATLTAQQTFAFTQAIGNAFLPAYLPLIERRQPLPFTPADKHAQHIKRGRYAEFNLLYDRGTRFGLHSGGNPETVLMSLPPTACW